MLTVQTFGSRSSSSRQLSMVNLTSSRFVCLAYEHLFCTSINICCLGTTTPCYGECNSLFGFADFMDNQRRYSQSSNYYIGHTTCPRCLSCWYFEKSYHVTSGLGVRSNLRTKSCNRFETTLVRDRVQQFIIPPD